MNSFKKNFYHTIAKFYFLQDHKQLIFGKLFLDAVLHCTHNGFVTVKAETQL